MVARNGPIPAVAFEADKGKLPRKRRKREGTGNDLSALLAPSRRVTVAFRGVDRAGATSLGAPGWPLPP